MAVVIDTIQAVSFHGKGLYDCSMLPCFSLLPHLMVRVEITLVIGLV